MVWRISPPVHVGSQIQRTIARGIAMPCAGGNASARLFIIARPAASIMLDSRPINRPLTLPISFIDDSHGRISAADHLVGVPGLAKYFLHSAVGLDSKPPSAP